MGGLQEADGKNLSSSLMLPRFTPNIYYLTFRSNKRHFLSLISFYSA